MTFVSFFLLLYELNLLSLHFLPLIPVAFLLLIGLFSKPKFFPECLIHFFYLCFPLCLFAFLVGTLPSSACGYFIIYSGFYCVDLQRLTKFTNHKHSDLIWQCNLRFKRQFIYSTSIRGTGVSPCGRRGQHSGISFLPPPCGDIDSNQVIQLGGKCLHPLGLLGSPCSIDLLSVHFAPLMVSLTVICLLLRSLPFVMVCVDSHRHVSFMFVSFHVNKDYDVLIMFCLLILWRL